MKLVELPLQSIQGHKHFPTPNVVFSKRRHTDRMPQAPKGFPGPLVVKNPPAKEGDGRDRGLIPGLGRCPGGGHGNPPQDSCLENPVDRGA